MSTERELRLFESSFLNLNEIVDDGLYMVQSSKRQTLLFPLGTKVSEPDTGLSYAGDGSTVGGVLIQSGTIIKADKVESVEGNISLDFTDDGDDRGLQVLGGQLSVGAPGAGQETCLGEGDSVPVDIAFHCTSADTTGDTIVNAINITEQLRSDSGSTVGLFGGTTSGHYIIVGSDFPFQGVKVKNAVCGVIEPENVQLASWRGSDTFFDVNIMNTNADYPHTQYGNLLCQNTSEQWYFGFDPTTPSTWAPVTININGQDITKYWGRYIINSDITSDSQIEQMKVHVNRMEINATGISQYFGLARYPQTLQTGLGATVPNIAYNPVNENVLYGNNNIADYNDNEFADGTTDGFIIVQGIETGMDTSIPIIFNVSYYVKGSATGDVKLNLDVFQVKDGFVYDGTEIPETFSSIETISAPSDKVRRTAQFLINAESLKASGDGLMISLYRNATAGETEDTLAASIVVTNITLIGHFWRP